jgi:hypothetical protein
MGVTGILMFFHLDSGLNAVLHEWASWVMVVGVSAHLVLNWRPFTTYLKRPLAQVIMAGGLALLALSFWPVSGGGGGHPAQLVMQAMARSDVATVIALSGHELQAGLDALEAIGLTAEGVTTIAELTGGSRDQQKQVIDVLFSH